MILLRAGHFESTVCWRLKALHSTSCRFYRSYTSQTIRLSDLEFSSSFNICSVLSCLWSFLKAPLQAVKDLILCTVDHNLTTSPWCVNITFKKTTTDQTHWGEPLLDGKHVFLWRRWTRGFWWCRSGPESECAVQAYRAVLLEILYKISFPKKTTLLALQNISIK